MYSPKQLDHNIPTVVRVRVRASFITVATPKSPDMVFESRVKVSSRIQRNRIVVCSTKTNDLPERKHNKQVHSLVASC